MAVPSSKAAVLLAVVISSVRGFAPTTPRSVDHSLRAAPQRLEENVDGPLFVNDRCINCSACSHFAPSIFTRNDRDNAHHVYRQPETEEEIENARASLSACPVAAIRVENKASCSHRGDAPMSDDDAKLAPQLSLSPKLNGLEPPFPRRVSSNVPEVYYLGHHNEASFGATPYLVRSGDVWIMVDTPRFGKSARDAVEKIVGPNGPDYLFLTHIDDTADHLKWREHYGESFKRIFHSSDLGRGNWLGDASLEQVEILLHGDSPDDLDQPFQYFTIDGEAIPAEVANDDRHDIVILHTPGHSRGSSSLWKKPTLNSPGVLFTGDMYAYTTRHGGHMTAFPHVSRNLAQQSRTIRRLLNLDWKLLAPSHSHVRDYTAGVLMEYQRMRHTAAVVMSGGDSINMEPPSPVAVVDQRRADMESALDELRRNGAHF